MAFDATEAWFWRIEPPFMDGNWEATDSTRRFRLGISGADVQWIERNAKDGMTLRRSARPQEQADGSFRIERQNDDEALRFLDFLDAKLRGQIIAAGPKPSYLIPRRSGEKLLGKWHGLAVRKKPNQTFDGLIQPGTDRQRKAGAERVVHALNCIASSLRIRERRLR